MTLSSGVILNNRYRIVKLLGQGGFGAVYRAWDTNFDEPVAIKESIDISPSAQKQFKTEARLLFKLHHANLPRVFDYFVVPEQGQYLVMDFVEGQDLGEMLKSGPMPEAKVLPWIIQVCDALSYLHSQDPPVIHRDIKPGNIKITPEGRAMLVDFGISKVYDPNLATTVGGRAVTPGYSPPEQYGKGATDVRSDLYALGATLYHLLTGQLPPDSVDILAHTAPPPSPVVDLISSISETIGDAIARAMSLEREARWANAEEFKQALTTQPSYGKQRDEGIISDIGVSHLSPPSLTVPNQMVIDRTRRRIPWIWLGVAGTLLVVVVLGIYGIISIIPEDGTKTRTSIATTKVVDLLPSNTLPLPTTATQKPPTKIPPTSTTHVLSKLYSVAADFTDEKGVPMNLIPASEFQMGLWGGWDEHPVHIIYLDAFYMDIYEVTNTLYTLCIEAGVCTEPSSKNSSTRGSYYGNSTYDDYPVIYVSWGQARDYCEWRGARLPTEAEWEKAARGGLEGNLYPWGDQLPNCEKANCKGKDGYCEGDTTRVGSYPPNGYGLFDMAGNVWEWVWDWYSRNYYTISPSQNPTGPSEERLRCLRGGSWYNDYESLRVSRRNYDDTTAERRDVGFRCARSP